MLNVPINITVLSAGMFNEGESDLVYTVSPYEFEQIYR